jgi:hypothetical protein
MRRRASDNKKIAAKGQYFLVFAIVRFLPVFMVGSAGRSKAKLCKYMA